jgi:predicted ATPase
MGKTSVVEQLEGMGFSCVPESGRDIIRHQLATGGNNLPWKDKEAFAGDMFNRAVKDYHNAESSTGYTFFDRGIPDAMGYLELCGLPVPQDITQAANLLRYNPRVFIAAPWRDIFCNDDERTQSFEEAVATYEVMRSLYSRLGYELVTIPEGTVQARAKFILEQLGSEGAYRAE